MLVTSACRGCGSCVPLCPQGAIRLQPGNERKRAVIDQEHCMECGVCLDSGVCTFGALREGDTLRDTVRRLFGRMAPVTLKKEKSSGRTGSWDVKTCDSGRPLPAGEAIIRVELGRPEGGVTLVQAERLRQALLQQGYQPEEQRAYQTMLELLGPEALEQEAGGIRVLSVCLEYRCEPDRLVCLLDFVEDWAQQQRVRYRVNALFSPGLLPKIREILEQNGRSFGLRCKCNLGFAHREGAAS